MKTVRVTYTTKAEYAAHNQENIKKVMTDLQELKHADLFYHACLNADGKTFVHTAFFKGEDDEKVLLGLPAFKTFQEELKASGLEAPPRQELLSLVGWSHNIINA